MAGRKTALLPILWAWLFAPLILFLRSFVSWSNMNTVSSCRAQTRPEVFQEVMFAVMPDQVLPFCPGFLASPNLIPVVPS
eukprot:5116753-Heterocapsa_arctica.AAC.1